MIEKLKDPSRAGELFKGWQETMIWSCLQNVMGEIYGDHPSIQAVRQQFSGTFPFLQGSPGKNCSAAASKAETWDFGFWFRRIRRGRE